MSVVSDSEIKRMVKDGELKIEPFDESQVNPASYDLKIGKKVTE